MGKEIIKNKTNDTIKLTNIIQKFIEKKNKRNNERNNQKKNQKIELYKDKSIDFLKNYFNLNSQYHFYILNSCDASIFYALNAILSNKEIKNINIPSTASWLSYEPFCELLNKINNNYKINKYDFKNYEPNYEELKQENDNLNIIQLNPGYLNYVEIEKIPKNSIIDASGFKNKVNLNDFDCIVLSFQHWKPINIGFGGFIAIKKELDIKKKEKTYLKKILDPQIKSLENSKISKKIINFNIYFYKKLYYNLNNLDERINKFQTFFDNKIISIMNFLKKENINFEIKFFENSLNALIITNLEKNQKDELIIKLKQKFKEIDFKNDLDIRFKGISVEIKRFFK
ncbi:MAG: hypothetical protein PHT94_01290 [Candidatus Nanoarchaeia archaeon]|nr:hypothetical protein [Candidatus Nanoarchaeia archaeon]